MNDPDVGRCLLSTVVPALLVGVEPGGAGARRGSGTLLGFEESEPWRPSRGFLRVGCCGLEYSSAS